MRALLYVLGARWKNQLRSFFRSPGKLILTLIFVGLFGVTLWSGQHGEAEVTRDLRELHGMILGLYLFMMVLTLSTGLSKGTTFFRMSDVNLLFPAPISPIKVLLYGLGQQLGSSLMIGFFLVYQYGWLHSAYGVELGGLVIILLGYALVLFVTQLLAMVVYALTSVGERRRTMAKVVIWGAGALLLIQPALGLLNQEGDIMPALVDAAMSLPVRLIPIAGWMATAVSGVLMGNSGAFWGGLATLILAGGLVVLLILCKADYYEDVLQASENAHTVREKAKEGVVHDTRKIKAGATGLGFGWGGSALYAKQRLENRRERIILLDKNSWIFLAVPIFFGYIMGSEGWMPGLLMGTYMQLFSTTTGRWARELLMHHVYLIPETPFRKLWFCLCQGFEKLALESLIQWGILGLLLGLNPGWIALLILVRFSFGLLFLGGYLLLEQLWGHIVVKWLVMTLFFILEIVLVVPGIVLAFVLPNMGWVLFTADVTTLLIMIAWNLLLGLGLLFACRNVMERAEMNQQQSA